MATISSIGTAARTYSTVAAWLTAFAAGGWEGELYNDSQFTAGGSFSGHATSVTDYIILRCATGQGWRDNASVQSNAFAFDSTKGVSFTSSTATIFTIAEDFVTLSGLQVAFTTTSSFRCVANATVATTNCVVENCIFESSASTGNVQWASGILRNCLIVVRTVSNRGGVATVASGTSKIINCTIVRPSNFTAANSAISIAGTVTVENCAGFGFSNFTSVSPSAGSNNCSDVTISFGTSNQASKTYLNQFAVTTDTGRDFKVKDNLSALYDTGVTDTTNVPSATDAAGTSRPQGSAWDIGAWELVVSGGTTHPSTGALVGQGATASGTAARFRAHPASGALTGQGATVAGTARHIAKHATSGALVGLGATIAGTAARVGGPTSHATSGALIGTGSVIAGTAARVGPAVSHNATGVLRGQGAAIAGIATLIGQNVPAVGGHFLPEDHRRHRQRQKRAEELRDTAAAARRLDSEGLARSIREQLLGAKSQPAGINTELSVETDDDDDDVAFLLLHG